MWGSAMTDKWSSSVIDPKERQLRLIPGGRGLTAVF